MRLLSKGSNNSTVTTLQKALNLHGFGPLEEDGAFGPATESALIQFQQSNALEADGIAGPMTWQVLLSGPARRLKPSDPWAEKKMELHGHLAASALNLDNAVFKTLGFAIHDIGKKEKPLGSNSGPPISHIVRGYGTHWGIEEKGYPWCAIAVCHWTARGMKLGDKSAQVDWTQHPFGAWLGGVTQIEAWAKKKGRIAEKAAIGHIFTMPRAGSNSDPAASTRAGHCGLVVGVDGTHVVTVEGNVSNRVDSRVRKKEGLTFIRWW